MVHKDYVEEDFLVNDIAMITLATPISQRIAAGIRATSISLPNSAQDNPPIGSVVTAIGWGRTQYHSDEAPRILQGVQLPVLSVAQCGLRAGEKEQESKICTDSTNAAVCMVKRICCFDFGCACWYQWYF